MKADETTTPRRTTSTTVRDRVSLSTGQVKQLDALVARVLAVSPSQMAPMIGRRYVLSYVLIRGFDAAVAWVTSIEAERKPSAPVAQVAP